MATKDKNPNKSYSFRVLAKVRGNFLAGLIVIAPIGFTMWIINSIIGWIDGWVLPLIPYNYHFAEYIGINLKGLGVIFFLVFTVLVGWVAKGILGRTFLRVGENLVDRTPIVRSVYSGIKQIAETVLSSRDSSFEKACLIEYPRKGIWAIAFVASDSRGEIVYASWFTDWFSEEAKRTYGKTIPSTMAGRRIMTIKQPIGVCGIITPWNFPADRKSVV